MGADSLGSSGGFQEVNNVSKVFHNELNVIIGGTTTFRHLDLLHYAKFFTEDELKLTIDHKYMVTEFIPKIYDLFNKGVYDQSENNRGGNFLIGVKNKLFEVQADYSVLDPLTGYSSVGCGCYSAMGSLYATSSKNMKLSPEEQIKIALKSAEINCGGVGKPFIIINTKNNKIIKIK